VFGIGNTWKEDRFPGAPVLGCCRKSGPNISTGLESVPVGSVLAGNPPLREEHFV
jgi:hypothetical protein